MRARARARGSVLKSSQAVETLDVFAGLVAYRMSLQASRQGVGGLNEWTEEEDDILREVSYRGAKYASAEIYVRCGKRRTPRAVEMRACRIHCSLARRTVCPECGATGVRINRMTGMCRLCSERFHLEQEKIFHEELEHERIEVEQSDEVEVIKRERDRLRKANSRLCQRYGLPSRRERTKRVKQANL